MAGLWARWFGRRTAGPPIVVVSGLPRSGTSMLMGMLSAGGLELVVDGIREADADNPKGYYEWERVKELDKAGDKRWVGDVRGKGMKVISFLLPHLPDAYDYKIVFLRRSLPEVLASQQKMLARRGEPLGDRSDEEMAELFRSHLAKVETTLAGRAGCDVLYVDYGQAVTEPAGVARRVADFLGSGVTGRVLDVDAMAAAVDTALYRNRV